MPSPTEITVAQLARLIGTPAAPVIIDTCIDDDFALDPRTIPTAMRHPFRDVAALTPMLQGKRVVVYCQKGKKISQGAAAILRDAGIETETLAGGVVAWAAAGAPLVRPLCQSGMPRAARYGSPANARRLTASLAPG